MPLDQIELMKPAGLKSLEDIDLDKHICEVKLDGMRAKVGRRNDGTVDLFSYAGKSQLGKCPHLEELLQQLPPGTVLDGEFVVYKDANKVSAYSPDYGAPVDILIPNFTYTMNVMGSKPGEALRKQEAFGEKVTLVLFDILVFGGKSLMHQPLQMRRGDLQDVIEGHLQDRYVRLSDNLRWDPSFERQLIDLDAEGLMFKNPLAHYEEGKRPKNNWWKYKFEFEADVVITGFQEGLGKYADTIGAVTFGQYRDGKLVERGKTSGMTDKLRYHMGENRDEYIGKVMVIKHKGILKDAYRHPQFKTIRPDGDKLPEQCEWEEV